MPGELDAADAGDGLGGEADFEAPAHDGADERGPEDGLPAGGGCRGTVPVEECEGLGHPLQVHGEEGLAVDMGLGADPTGRAEGDGEEGGVEFAHGVDVAGVHVEDEVSGEGAPGNVGLVVADEVPDEHVG